MKVKRILCCLVAICMLAFTGCSDLPADNDFPKVPVINVSNIDTYAEEVVTLANAERAKAGVPTVAADSRLMELADIRVYLKTQNCTKRQEKDIKGFYHRQCKEVIA